MESLQGGGCRQLRESGGYIRETASLLTDMAVRDLSSSYRDAAGGYVWLFAKPAVTVLVYYIVFQVFFGMSETNSGVPYALWFLSGMLQREYFFPLILTDIQCGINQPFALSSCDTFDFLSALFFPTG